MESCDCVVGAVTGYKWDQIKYWANSLDRCGFTGKKVVIAYNLDAATVKELTDRNYIVIGFQKDSQGKCTYPNENFNIVVDRFLHLFLFLPQLQKTTINQEIRYVIATDVRDVVFQTNPSEYLEKRQGQNELIVSSESIKYEHEVWGKNNLKQSFGEIMYEAHKGNEIINCGVLAGRLDMFVGLCKTIWLLSVNATQHVPGGGGPDQAALNLILSTPAYRNTTEITDIDTPWASQLGTTMDPRKLHRYLQFLPLVRPSFNEKKVQVETPAGIPYAIVHQYDRVPEIKEAFERKYS